MKPKPILTSLALFALTALTADRAASTAPTRPMIWATAADRAPILDKIKSQPWAQSVFAAM